MVVLGLANQSLLERFFFFQGAACQLLSFLSDESRGGGLSTRDFTEPKKVNDPFVSAIN